MIVVSFEKITKVALAPYGIGLDSSTKLEQYAFEKGGLDVNQWFLDY
jgi:hypothetical protein